MTPQEAFAQRERRGLELAGELGVASCCAACRQVGVAHTGYYYSDSAKPRRSLWNRLPHSEKPARSGDARIVPTWDGRNDPRRSCRPNDESVGAVFVAVADRPDARDRLFDIFGLHNRHALHDLVSRSRRAPHPLRRAMRGRNR